MKAAIFGAGGFLGRSLSLRMIEAGWHVTGYDIASPGLDSKRFTFYRHDILSDSLEPLHQTDVVYYLAQSPHYRNFPEKSDQLFGVNSLGVAKVATAAKYGKVRTLVFASTGNVYVPSFKRLPENREVDRSNPYALSKIMAEELLDLYRGDLQTVSIRFFGIFGPNQQSMLPATLFNAVIASQPIYLEPSVKDCRDDSGLKVSFAYVLDVCEWLLDMATLSLDGVNLPARLNLAGPEGISIRKFADTIGAIRGKTPQFIKGECARTFDLVADTTVMHRLLSPQMTPFEKAMTASYKRP